MVRDRLAPLQPFPQLTKDLREDVTACAAMLQNHPDAFTAALCDPSTRKEIRLLVADLFSLCELIVDDDAKEKEKDAPI